MRYREHRPAEPHRFAKVSYKPWEICVTCGRIEELDSRKVIRDFRPGNLPVMAEQKGTE